MFLQFNWSQVWCCYLDLGFWYSICPTQPIFTNIVTAMLSKAWQPCHLLTDWVSAWLNNFWDPFWARVTTAFIVNHSKIKVKIAVCFSISVVAIINLCQVVNTNWWKYEGKVREFLWQVGMMGARLEFLLINRTQPTQSCHQVGKYTRRPKLCESFQSDI